jgi:tRNA modification GTPase
VAPLGMSQPDYDFPTIAAVATPPGYGGIGIIRISGTRAVELLRQMLVHGDRAELDPNRAVLHQIRSSTSGHSIDHAIVTCFKAPHSFTGEDVVEISAHGSPVVLGEILAELLTLGAKPAEPGEFSLRAFLNGRMDLAQAEAVRDLIHAQTSYQARLAARQMRGELSLRLSPIKATLTRLIVHFESAVEFVEDDLDALDIARFSEEIEKMAEDLRQLASSYRLGRVVRSGLRLALVGKPNVGKSSVFNSLLGRDRAIVTPIPGTTRDSLSEVMSIRGIPIDLVDTAGIRETEDLVEQLGVERSLTVAVDADLVLGVIDASDPSNEQEMAIDGAPIDIYVLNKSDLPPAVDDAMIVRLGVGGRPVLRVSALTGEGIEELRDALFELATSGAASTSEGAIITSERHFAAIEAALQALDKARQDLRSGLTEEVALANLHEALRSLGVITGETLIGDIINQIFATFCIGK